MCQISNLSSPSSLVGRFTEIILATMLSLDKPSSAREIRDILEKELGKQVSVGALYITLDRLEEKGFISSFEEGPTGKPGGRSKRLFCLTHKGEQSIRAVKEFTKRVWGPSIVTAAA